MQDLSHNTTVIFMILPHQNWHIYHIHHQKLLGNISELSGTNLPKKWEYKEQSNERFQYDTFY